MMRAKNAGTAVKEAASLRVVSKGLRKIDNEAIVRGEARYTADMLPPGTLYAKILRSPHAHARLKSIKVDKALAIAGVSLVLTHENVPRIPHTSPLPMLIARGL